MVKMLSGGGINSNKVVQSKGYKTEPKAKAANVAGVAQQGVSTQFRKEPLFEGKGYSPGEMAPTGSRGVYNSATSGPGSQRTVYKAGTQQATPQAEPMPAGRDTMAEYGPEIS